MTTGNDRNRIVLWFLHYKYQIYNLGFIFWIFAPQDYLFSIPFLAALDEIFVWKKMPWNSASRLSDEQLGDLWSRENEDIIFGEVFEQRSVEESLMSELL